MTRQEFCNAAQRLLGEIEKGSISVEMVEGDILEGQGHIPNKQRVDHCCV